MKTDKIMIVVTRDEEDKHTIKLSTKESLELLVSYGITKAKINPYFAHDLLDEIYLGFYKEEVKVFNIKKDTLDVSFFIGGIYSKEVSINEFMDYINNN